MATRFFCDRCHAEAVIKRMQFVEYPMPAVYATPWGGDLCERCIAKVVDFLKPQPMEMKGLPD